MTMTNKRVAPLNLQSSHKNYCNIKHLTLACKLSKLLQNKVQSGFQHGSFCIDPATPGPPRTFVSVCRVCVSKFSPSTICLEKSLDSLYVMPVKSKPQRPKYRTTTPIVILAEKEFFLFFTEVSHLPKSSKVPVH